MVDVRARSRFRRNPHQWVVYAGTVEKLSRRAGRCRRRGAAVLRGAPRPGVHRGRELMPRLPNSYLRSGAIVGKRAHHPGELPVGSCHCPCIAQGSEVFPGIETVSGSVAEISRASLAEAAAVRLRVVFYQGAVRSAGTVRLCFRYARSARIDAPSLPPVRGPTACSIFDGSILKRVWVRFHKHRRQSAFRYGEYRCYECVGGNYHFVAGMQFSQFDVGAEYRRQRIKSVSGSDASRRRYTARTPARKPGSPLRADTIPISPHVPPPAPISPPKEAVISRKLRNSIIISFFEIIPLLHTFKNQNSRRVVSARTPHG